MKLLIIENSIEGQTNCVKRIESFNRSDVEVLDLRTKLVLDRDYKSQIGDAEVVLLGSGLADSALQITRHIRSETPWVYVLIYVTDQAYSGGAFRAAYDAGARKVLPDSAKNLDLLQELVAINAEFRREGRTREGKVICVTHAKGGTGATTICAALAEVCSVYRRRTLIWDLDVETRDLCRSLTVSGSEAKVVTSWVNGSREISRESLSDALIPLSSEVSVLMPPDSMAEAMDLICHTDGISICQRILEVSRIVSDVVIIDTGGRIGPATGALMRSADEVVIVIDDTVLGLTALDLYLNYLKFLVLSPDRLSFLVNGYSGVLLGVQQIEDELEPAHHLGPRPWRLPPVPVDLKAANWPGSGKTLYSMGQKSTRAALEQISTELGIVSSDGVSDSKQDGSWWNRLLTR